MIRIATVGTSQITDRFAEAVARVPGIEIAAVYSRDLARADVFADRWKATGRYGDFDQLLAYDLDAVYLASPNTVHAEQASACLRAGKHVLVEKPAVTSAAQWQELVGFARSSQLVLLEEMRTAYDPGLARVREVLPELGRLRKASLRYEKRSSRYDLVLAGQQVNIFDPAFGGGALFDLGVYCVHALVNLFGEPDAVTGWQVLVASGADGAGSALARYPGMIAELGYSKITDSTLPSEVQGELGTLVIDELSSPRLLELHRGDGTVQRIEIDAEPDLLDGSVRRLVEAIGSGADITGDQDLTAATLRVLDTLRSDAASSRATAT